MTAPIYRTVDALRQEVRAWKRAGHTVGVVPTMGALHEGHLSLVDRAKTECDRVIVTIFVNPKQFNNPDDLAKYPRTEDSDAEKLAPFGVDAIFAPNPDEVYPNGFATKVSVSGLTDMLCGAHRPGHFDGVATVVTKLFLQTLADRAYFGEKDYQQLQIVKRMATDLNIPTDVVPCPTIREADGLALSSRNLRLSDAARRAAPALIKAMRTLANGLQQNQPIDQLTKAASETILSAGFDSIDYLELRDGAGLAPQTTATKTSRIFAAATIDNIRLIDNIPVFSD
ncbi:pantoate--beta-alanine ligase [Pseudoprimorskyibacter insulae]|uniref:Pantothenate synthetase n=1 Tax=Pseudoprimorskyibacter insulae TaxID=1695997 RepID=A0A2R8AUT4_9RHOB|nr:pantoate--beta-alanine ligase [Pseudoprimorskyibacter insulae]SPF79776.1 Pantothenate synthetase [Pseudoprimorskyibacter insulae]